MINRFILFIYNIIVCNLIIFAIIVKYFEACLEKSFEFFFFSIKCWSLTEMFIKN